MTLDPPVPELSRLCRVTVGIAAPLVIGATAAGTRRVIPITGGKVEGEDLFRQRIIADEPRFSQLQTIREFAAEKAAELGILDEVRQRHADFFARLAEEAQAVIMGSQKRAWRDRQAHANRRQEPRWLDRHHLSNVAVRELIVSAKVNAWRLIATNP